MGKSERKNVIGEDKLSYPGPGDYEIKAFTDVIYENQLKKSQNITKDRNHTQSNDGHNSLVK